MAKPTRKEIEQASHFQLCQWWRFLPSEKMPHGEDSEFLKKRLFEEHGGFTPEISKSLGWG